MLSAPQPEPELLKTVLAPLLEDFLFWFGRTQKALETQKPKFLTQPEYTTFLTRLGEAQQAVRTAQTLLIATEGQAGVEMAVILPWHRLMMECWQIGWRSRQSNADRADLSE